MYQNQEQTNFVDIHFEATQERIKSFLQQFAPTCKGYLLDQSPAQLHSKEYTLRIYYEENSSLTITCYSAEILQQRIENICNINNKVRFVNCNPDIEEHTFNLPDNGKEDVTVYYSATLMFNFTGT